MKYSKRRNSLLIFYKELVGDLKTVNLFWGGARKDTCRGSIFDWGHWVWRATSYSILNLKLILPVLKFVESADKGSIPRCATEEHHSFYPDDNNSRLVPINRYGTACKNMASGHDRSRAKKLLRRQFNYPLLNIRPIVESFNINLHQLSWSS